MRSAVQIVQDAYAADGSGVELLPFGYTGRTGIVQPGTRVPSFQGNITIDRDSDFIWYDTRILCYTIPHGDFVPAFVYNFFLTFQLDTTGRYVEQGVNPLGGGAPIGCNPLTIAGQADRPFVFFEPILVPARTAIVITCFNPSNGVPIEAHYLLGGMKAVSVTQ